MSSREAYEKAMEFFFYEMPTIDCDRHLTAIKERHTFLEAQAAADVERMEKATALINSLTAERDELKRKVEKLQAHLDLAEDLLGK